MRDIAYMKKKTYDEIIEATKEKTKDNTPLKSIEIAEKIRNIKAEEAGEDLEAIIYNKLKNTHLNDDSITTLPAYAFYGSNVETVELNNLIDLRTENGSSVMVFSNCHNLKSVKAPKLKILTEGAFNGCFRLEEVYFPEVTTIESGALSSFQLKDLNSEVFPKLQTIFPGAFQDNNILETVDLDGEDIKLFLIDKSNLKTINLPNSGSIPNVNECENLTSIKAPKALNLYLVSNCQNLENLIVPNVMGYINFGDLQNLPSLKDLLFNKVSDISGLSQAEFLESLILNNEEIVQLNDFYYIEEGQSPIKDNLFIYVPDNLVDQYKEASTRSIIADKIKSISELPDNLKEKYRDYL